MTIFAGILGRRHDSLSDSTRRALTTSLSRDPRDQVQVFGGAHWCCAKLDIGAFARDGHLLTDGALSLLAGEPLLQDGGGAGTRDADLAVLHRDCEQGTLAGLRAATGAFTLVHLRPSDRRVVLIADKLGLRPLYYSVTTDFVIFATAMRILESLPGFDRTMDLRGMTEVTAFEYPLGDRTPYANVRRIHAAEVVDVDASSIRQSVYWRWDDIPVSTDAPELLAQRAHAAFVGGVKRRLAGARSATAFLSGGLDSRAVVGSLVSEGVQVRTFNFARRGTQDHFLGASMAESFGTAHHEYEKPEGARTPNYSEMMATAVRDAVDQNDPATSPRTVWSGEGGSVVLGHVHMHRPVVERLRSGNEEGAFDEFFDREDIRIPLKMFTTSVARSVARLVRDGVHKELMQLSGVEPGRRFHVFLLVNDQRRKLTRHFEDIDRHRLEWQLPFFDSAFVASVLAVPLDLCLEHRFYTSWFEQFDPIVRSVPWQSYPGHDPCPLPVPATLSYQWDSQYQAAERAAQKREVIARARNLLFAADFPRPLLSRSRVAVAAALHASGARNYEYALNAAALCHRYWRECEGRWA